MKLFNLIITSFGFIDIKLIVYISLNKFLFKLLPTAAFFLFSNMFKIIKVSNSYFFCIPITHKFTVLNNSPNIKKGLLYLAFNFFLVNRSVKEFELCI